MLFLLFQTFLNIILIHLVLRHQIMNQIIVIIYNILMYFSFYVILSIQIKDIIFIFTILIYY